MKFHTTFTRCRDGKPLLELDGQPFNGLEIRPTDLRRLGETLMWLADLGTALPTDGRDWKATKVEVDMDSTQRHPAPNDAAELAYRAVQFIKGLAESFRAANVPVMTAAQAKVAQPRPAPPPVGTATPAVTDRPACAESAPRGVAAPSALPSVAQAAHTSGELPIPAEARRPSVTLEIDLGHWSKPVDAAGHALDTLINKQG